jgi:hypothetical protein
MKTFVVLVTRKLARESFITATNCRPICCQQKRSIGIWTAATLSNTTRTSVVLLEVSRREAIASFALGALAWLQMVANSFAFDLLLVSFLARLFYERCQLAVFSGKLPFMEAEIDCKMQSNSR